MKTSLYMAAAIVCLPIFALSACSNGADHHANHSDHGHSHTHSEGFDTGLFNSGALVKAPETVDCTLENGAAAECVQLVVKYAPDNLEIGPFCPKTLNDVSGIWPWDGEKAGLYSLNKEFWHMLDAQGYTFFDPDGSVHIADIAVAEPVHDHACINVSEDESVEITMLIPLSPIKAQTTSRLGVVNKVGVALAGVPIFSDAPSVQRTGHLPALDVCAGHVDPGGWYHYHGTASDLDGVYKSENVDAQCHIPQNSAALFGYAFDGYPIYGHLEQDGSSPNNLDECNGHTDTIDKDHDASYHYHAVTDFPNLPSCLSGVSAQNNFSTTAQAGVGANPPEGTVITRGNPPRGEQAGGGPRGGAGGGAGGGTPPGFDQAAKTLGVTAEDLFSAMEAAGGRNADLAKVASALGVSEADLRAALPQRPGGR